MDLPAGAQRADLGLAALAELRELRIRKAHPLGLPQKVRIQAVAARRELGFHTHDAAQLGEEPAIDPGAVVQVGKRLLRLPAGAGEAQRRQQVPQPLIGRGAGPRQRVLRLGGDPGFRVALVIHHFLQGALPKRVSFDAPAAPATVPEPKLIYNNSENRPYVIHVRAANVQQTSVILLLDRTAENCKPTTAQIALEGVTPSISLIVRPNGKLFGSVLTTPAAAIISVAIPLNGRGVLFPESKIRDC